MSRDWKLLKLTYVLGISGALQVLYVKPCTARHLADTSRRRRVRRWRQPRSISIRIRRSHLYWKAHTACERGVEPSFHGALDGATGQFLCPSHAAWSPRPGSEIAVSVRESAMKVTPHYVGCQTEQSSVRERSEKEDRDNLKGQGARETKVVCHGG